VQVKAVKCVSVEEISMQIVISNMNCFDLLIFIDSSHINVLGRLFLFNIRI